MKLEHMLKNYWIYKHNKMNGVTTTNASLEKKMLKIFYGMRLLMMRSIHKFISIKYIRMTCRHVEIVNLLLLL